jgi:hypothetical protein
MSTPTAPASTTTPVVPDLPSASVNDKCKERYENYIADPNQKPTLKAMVEPLLPEAAKQGELMVTALTSAPYNCSMEMAIELSILTLYDLVVLIGLAPAILNTKLFVFLPLEQMIVVL